MKLSTMVIFSMILIFAITTFTDTGTVTPDSAVINNPSTDASGVIWKFMLNPYNWSATDGTSLIGWVMITLLFALGVSGTIATFLRVNVSDAIAFIPLVVVLLGVAAPSVIMLGNFIKTELTPIMCGGVSNCLMPTWIAIIFSAAFAMNWFFAVIKWWRTGFTE